MDTKQLYAGGQPIYPFTNYEANEIYNKISNMKIEMTAMQESIDEMLEKIETQLLKNTEIANWAKQQDKPVYTADEVGADTIGSAAEALKNAKDYANQTYEQATGYTDSKVAGLINGAPSTLDTLKEIADAMEENNNIIEALEKTMGTRAADADYQAHVANEALHVTASKQSKWDGYAAKIANCLPLTGGNVSGNVRMVNSSLILTEGYNLFFGQNYENRPNIGASYRLLSLNSGIVDNNLFYGVLDSTWTLCPSHSNTTLGTSNHKWGQIYSTIASISTSDRREKTDFRRIEYEQIKDFLKELTPVFYRLISHPDKEYAGLIAQDVEVVMMKHGISEDFGLLDKQPVYDAKGNETGDYTYGLCYEQLIALILVAIQYMLE